MPTIIVKWIPEEEFGYKKAMNVIMSDHPRFVIGTRFHFGFFDIATNQGYTIVSIPLDEKETIMKPKNILDSKDMGTDLRKLIGFVWARGNQKQIFPSEDFNKLVDDFVRKYNLDEKV
jgi:hypothetical protein